MTGIAVTLIVLAVIAFLIGFVGIMGALFDTDERMVRRQIIVSAATLIIGAGLMYWAMQVT